jgi:hypothetical protein
VCTSVVIWLPRVQPPKPTYVDGELPLRGIVAVLADQTFETLSRFHALSPVERERELHAGRRPLIVRYGAPYREISLISRRTVLILE